MYTNEQYNKVRRWLLTARATGRLIKRAVWLEGLDSEDKSEIVNEAIAQVFLVHSSYNERGIRPMSLYEAVGKVKAILYRNYKRRLLAEPMSVDQKKELLYRFFREQLGEELSWTRRDQVVSEYEVRMSNTPYIYVRKGEHWVLPQKRIDKYLWDDPIRSEVLTSGKSRRHDLLKELVWRNDNEFLQEPMLLEHLVDFYRATKTKEHSSYQEIMLSLEGGKAAPFSRDTALRRLKDYFVRALRLYGVEISKDVPFKRDITGMMEVYMTIDLLSRERDKGYSVVDVLNK